MKLQSLLALLLASGAPAAPSRVAVPAEEGGADIGSTRGRRRRRLGGRQDTRAEEAVEEAAKEAADEGFYDLSSFTEDEKLFLIKAVYTLTQYGHTVDWDLQRDRYIQTVLEDRKSRSQISSSAHAYKKGLMRNDGNDDAYGGRTDDTLDFFRGNDDAYDGLLDDTLDLMEMIDGNDDAYGGVADDTFERNLAGRSGETDGAPVLFGENDSAAVAARRRRLQDSGVDSAVFYAYEYSKGNCPNDGSLGVPCAPDNIEALCNKYNRAESSFKACLAACAPSICCVHDAPPETNPFAPNCNQDENCPQYNYCYIAWWKLHDTIGPAIYLRVEQNDDFFDISSQEIESDSTGDKLFEQVLLHHWDDIQPVIEEGKTSDGGFIADPVFQNEVNWALPEFGLAQLP